MTQTDARARASVDVLAEVANDLAGEFRLQPLLERILRSAVELLGCRSGSLCLIDQVSHTYRKEIDLDAGCQAGMVFSLDEGCTGAVARSGKPAIFEHYSEIAAGHIRPDEDRYHRAVIGVPILLRTNLIGACIVFAASDSQRFDPADAQLLQRFATHAAIAIANSRLHAEASERAKAAAVAAERERAMLEVHDSIGRGLATVALRIADAHAAASHGEDPLPALTQAQLAAQETMNEGRRAVWGLGPAGMAGRPIDQSIGLELDWVQATSDLAPTFRVFGDPRPLARNVETQVLRIVQESLANVVQHARATMVRVRLRYRVRRLNSVTRTMGIALTACTPPAKGSPLFELGEDEMEVGVGIHGEPGRRRAKLVSATEIVDELLNAVVSDLPYASGDRVALMINGLGGTPISELYLLYGIAAQKLIDQGITIARSYVGEYCTSLEMAGASLTLVKLDDEIEALLEAPASIVNRIF